MTRLSYTKYETKIKNLIRDYLDGYLSHSNYIDKATEVYDLAWNDENINTDEYMVLTLLVQASNVVYDGCNAWNKETKGINTTCSCCDHINKNHSDYMDVYCKVCQCTFPWDAPTCVNFKSRSKL